MCVPSRFSSQTRVFAAAQEVGGFNLLSPHVLSISSEVYFNLEPPAIHLAGSLPNISLNELIEEMKSGDKVFVAASIDNRTTQTLPLYQYTKKSNVDFTISLDNWVYFSERLVGIGPARLIVYDEFALHYAKRVFGDFHDIILVKNHYLNDICKILTSRRTEENSWLFVDARPNLFTIFDKDLHEIGCCCSQIETILKAGGNVTFRPHPSFKRKTCVNYLIAKYDARFRISNENVLYRDLFNHSHVLGSPGYALYVASQAGKQVFSTASTNSEWNGPVFNKLLGEFL